MYRVVFHTYVRNRFHFGGMGKNGSVRKYTFKDPYARGLLFVVSITKVDDSSFEGSISVGNDRELDEENDFHGRQDTSFNIDVGVHVGTSHKRDEAVIEREFPEDIVFNFKYSCTDDDHQQLRVFALDDVDETITLFVRHNITPSLVLYPMASRS